MILVGNISASRRETRGGIGRVCRPVTPRDLLNLGIPPPLPLRPSSLTQGRAAWVIIYETGAPEPTWRSKLQVNAPPGWGSLPCPGGTSKLPENSPKNSQSRQGLPTAR